MKYSGVNVHSNTAAYVASTANAVVNQKYPTAYGNPGFGPNSMTVSNIFDALITDARLILIQAQSVLYVHHTMGYTKPNI